MLKYFLFFLRPELSFLYDWPLPPPVGIQDEDLRNWRRAVFLLENYFFSVLFFSLFVFCYATRHLSLPILYGPCGILCSVVCHLAKQLQDFKVEKCLNILLYVLIENSFGQAIQNFIGHASSRKCFLLDLIWPTDPRFIKVKKWSRIKQHYLIFAITMAFFWSHALPGKGLYYNFHRFVSISQVHVIVVLLEGSPGCQNSTTQSYPSLSLGYPEIRKKK